MNRNALFGALVGASLLLVPFAIQAQSADLGKREYDSNCAVCHGLKGKGDGVYADLVSKRVPDLTLMAKTNAGMYPFSRVYQSIDGTQMPRPHGTSDMPIWGQDYKVRAGEYYGDMPYNQEAFVRARILALTEYVARLQVK